MHLPLGKIKQLIWRHYLAIILAGVMTLLVIAPLIAFPLMAKDQYRGINIANFSTDEYYYLTRGKEVLEGNGLGQPFLVEGKTGVDPTYGFGEKILLAPFTFFGPADHVDVVVIYNMYNAIGVFVLLLLLYGFAYRFFGNRLFAIATALFVVGGYSIIYNKKLFFSDLNIYNRSLFPYVSSILFFALTYCLYQLTLAKRAMIYTSVAAGLFGVSFYFYFYGWSFSLAFIAALLCGLAMTRDWQAFKRIGLVGGLGLVIGLPALITLYQLYSSPLGKQIGYFFWSSRGHLPIVSAVVVAVTILFAIFYFLRRRDKNMVFVFAMVLSGWVALNQQVITGRYIQYGHYYWYFVVPLAIIAGMYMIWRLLPQTAQKPTAWLLLGLALLNTVGGQYYSTQAAHAEKLRQQDYQPFLERLGAELQGGVLVGVYGGSNPFLVTIYTNNDLYWLPPAQQYNTDLDRLKEVLLVYLYLHKDARENPMEYLSQALQAGAIDEYVNLYKEIEGFYSGYDYYHYREVYLTNDPVITQLRARLLAELEEKYKTGFDSASNITTVLKQRGVRYILWDQIADPEWDLTSLDVELLMTRSSIALYQIN